MNIVNSNQIREKINRLIYWITPSWRFNTTRYKSIPSQNKHFVSEQDCENRISILLLMLEKEPYWV